MIPLATKLFASVGSAGAVLLRLVFASLGLMALWRPPLRSRWSPREWTTPA